MKDDQIQDIFQVLRELPPELSMEGMEKFILVQPATIFQPPNGGGSLSSSAFTIKNIIIMISTISVIGSAILVLGNIGNKSTINLLPQKDNIQNIAGAKDSAPDLANTLLQSSAVSQQNIENTQQEGSNKDLSIRENIAADVKPEGQKMDNNVLKSITGCDDQEHITSKFLGELVKDGLIDSKNFMFQINHTGLFINNKKQENTVFKRYSTLFEMLSGKSISPKTNLVVSVDGENCSANLSIDDDGSHLTANDVVIENGIDVVIPNDKKVELNANESKIRHSTKTTIKVSKNHKHSVTTIKELPEFSIVNLQLTGNLIIQAGDTYSISLAAGNEAVYEKVSTSVQNGILIVDGEAKDKGKNYLVLTLTVPADKLKGLHVMSRGSIVVDSGFTAVQQLIVNGSGDIMFNHQVVAAGQLQVAVLGSGSVNIPNIQAKSIVISIPGSGVVEMGGVAEEVKATVSGSGVANLEKLSAQTASCYINGSGIIEVQAIQELDILISGSGLVSYWGNATVRQSVTGSGMVEKKQ